MAAWQGARWQVTAFSGVRRLIHMHTHVDDIERALRKDMPEIVRVVGHAEPERSVKRPSA